MSKYDIMIIREFGSLSVREILNFARLKED